MSAKVEETPKKPRRRWRRIFLCLFLLILLVVWFAPAIVAHTFLRNQIAQSVLSDLNGKVHIGGASLGWFSNPVFTNLTLTDAQGKTVLSVPKVTGSKSLWSLIWNHSDIGTIRCEQPKVHLVCREKTTNLEEVLAELLKPSEGEAEPIGLRIEIVEGHVSLREESTEKEWSLHPVQCTVQLPQGKEAPTQIQLESKLAIGKEPASGSLKVEATLAGAIGKVDLNANGIPLGMAQAIGKRFDPSLRTSGELSCQLTGEWKESTGALAGRISAGDLYLAGSWLGGDRIRLSKVDLPCQIALDKSRVTIEQAELACDLGYAKVKGSIDIEKPFMASLQAPGNEIKVDVDLAKTAKMLPATLRIQSGTEILAGRLNLNIASAAQKGGVLWKGKLTTSDLRGKNGTTEFVWNDPIALDFALHQEGKGLPVVDHLQCRSAFLNLTGRGTADKFTVTAHYDLDRLAKELGRFVDFGELKMAGHGVTRLTLERKGEESFSLDSTSTLDDYYLQMAKDQRWKEKQLTLRLSGKGTVLEDGKYRLDMARGEVLVGSDRAEARLLKPWADLTDLSLEAYVRVQGDLKRWKDRVGAFVTGLDDLALSGAGALSGQLHLKLPTIELKNAQLTASQLVFRGVGLNIQEPSALLRASAVWDEKAETISLSHSHLECPTVTLDSEKLEVLLSSPSAIPLVGKLQVRGDIGRAHKWLVAETFSKPYPLSGTVSGSLDLQPVGKGLNITLNAVGKNIVAGPAANPDWSEPNPTLQGRMAFHPSTDQITIERLRLNGKMLTATATGALSKLSTDQHLKLQGQWTYDLQKLKGLLPAATAAKVQVVGQGTKPFSFEGALASGLPTWLAQVQLDWKSLNAFGCTGGPANLLVKLDTGWLRLDPIQCQVNQGQLHLQPSLRLEPGPLELHVAKGTVLQRAQITPAMCGSAVKYAVPALAGVTEGEGELSLVLNDCRMTLDDISKSHILGALQIHKARIGGTPLIRELSTLLVRRPAQVELRSGSQISFRMRDGWVEHRGLEIVFPELTVRTYGAVRMDGQLSMVAQFPIPPKWVGGRRIGKALENRVVSIPLGGTLENPRLDRAALRNELNRFLRDVGGEILKDKLNLEDRLKKLFDRK